MNENKKLGDPLSGEIALLLQAENPLEAFGKDYVPATAVFELAGDLYRSLVENSLGLICVHDLHGKLLYVNAAAAHSLGYIPSAGLGRNLREFLVPSVQHLFDAYLERIAERRTDCGYMRLMTRAGVERIWLYRNVLHDSTNGTYVLGHALDITELKRTKDALRDSYKRLEGLVAERTAELELANRRLESQISERKQVEEVVYRQALTFEQISDGLILSDQLGHVLDWNPAAETMFGYLKSEVLGRQVALLDPPDLRSELSSQIVDGLREAGRWKGEIPFVRKDGTSGIRELTVLPIHDQAGSFVATIGVNRDVTERVRAVEALRRSEELFRLTLDNASDVVVIVDQGGLIQFISPSVERVLGYKPEEVLRRSCLSVLPPATMQAAGSLLATRVSGLGEAKHREFPCQHKDGSWRILETIGRPFQDASGARFLVLNARDATERKAVEETLRLSEERYRALFERSLAGVLRCTIDGTLLEWNRAFAETLGYRKEDLVGLRTPELFFDAEQNDRFLAAVDQNVLLNDYEICLRHKQGGSVWVLANASRIDGEGENPAVIVATVIDITQRKQLEEQLRHSQKMEAVGRLAGGVAHDFNNLLTVISGYSDIVGDSLAPGDTVRWQVHEIKKAAERAAALTSQLLAFSRRQMIQPSVLDLNTVVAGVHNMLRRVIGEDIELLTVFHARPTPIRADLGQMEQVLLNLVVNARDAMPEGGTLTIETEVQTIGLPSYPSRPGSTERPVPPGKYVVLIVRDTGCGMDFETQSRIFEPFFTTKEQGKGTGLGLSTVYGIARQSGGYIHVSSAVGKGAEFKIYLPWVVEALVPERHAEGSTLLLQGNETLLLVEDDDMVRRMIREILQRHGYTVLEAQHGAEALELLALWKDSVRAILTDMVMPLMGGRQLIDRVQAGYPDLKIVCMSGYTEDANFPEHFAGRDHAFIAKPFTPERLLHKLRSVLDGNTGPGN